VSSADETSGATTGLPSGGKNRAETLWGQRRRQTSFTGPPLEAHSGHPDSMNLGGLFAFQAKGPIRGSISCSDSARASGSARVSDRLRPRRRTLTTARRGSLTPPWDRPQSGLHRFPPSGSFPLVEWQLTVSRISKFRCDVETAMRSDQVRGQRPAHSATDKPSDSSNARHRCLHSRRAKQKRHDN
jgi:hypothetical protein